jgi:UDP-glucose:(heptosyl)LPS alpha-1,3-glucosyltransferase
LLKPDAMPADLAIAICTFNSMRTIARTLESVQGLAERIVVVDSGSSDGTVELCRRHGAEVIHRDWPGMVEQRRFSLAQVHRHRWVLLLDSDEALEAELRRSIVEAVERDDPAYDGWEVNRKVWFLGGWLHHTFQPEWRLRLVRGGKASVAGRDPHDQIEVEGRVGRLRGDLRHDSWASAADMAERSKRYARAAAADADASAPARLLVSPPAAFIKQYLVKRGFLDGRRGLVAAWMTARGAALKHAYGTAALFRRQAAGAPAVASTPRSEALHVVFVHPRYRPDGGVERYLSRAAGALIQRGARVSILSRNWRGAGDGVRAIACNPPYIGRTWDEWGFARRACRLLRELNADCVQSQVRMPCCDIYRAGGGVHREWLVQRGRALGPLRRLSMAMSPYHRYVLAAERALFTSERLRAVICNSMMVRDEIIRHFGTSAEKIHVIYNGIDPWVFRPPRSDSERAAVRNALRLREDDVLYLFVGSGFGRKGLAALLRAFVTLPGEAHLAVVGRDKRMRGFQRLAERLCGPGRVHFLGPREDVVPCYHAADAFALPTLYDPFPNAVLEAMACGLPVVTSVKCGAVDLIRSGENGLLCDALDIESLGAHLQTLLDGERRRAIGEAGRRTVAPLTLEAMADSLLRLYQRVIGSGSGGVVAADRAAAAPAR